MKIIETMNDFVVVEPLAKEEKTSEGGLVMVDLKPNTLEKGNVVFAGPGRYEGERFVRNPFKVGDKVWFHRAAFYEIEYDNKKMLVLKPHDIMFKLG